MDETRPKVASGAKMPVTKRPVAKRPKKPRPVAFVRCGGASPVCEGGPVCEQGCVGCGACVAACKFGAVSINDHGVAVVDRELCRGCSMCMRKCPRGVIEMVSPDRPIRVRCINASPGKESRAKCAVSCVACGACVRVCPADAIHLDGYHAAIDYELCFACGMCATKCPRDAISDAFGMFASE